MEIEENDEISEKVMAMSKEMGLFGLSIPEEYGGTGLAIRNLGSCEKLLEMSIKHAQS